MAQVIDTAQRSTCKDCGADVILLKSATGGLIEVSAGTLKTELVLNSSRTAGAMRTTGTPHRMTCTSLGSDRALCKSCSAPIRWVKMENGKPHPVDADKHDPALIISGDQTQGAAGFVGVSHFATCPQAATHRKKGKS